MARRCEICGKGPQTRYKVSHAHNRTKKRWYPNISKIRVIIDGVVKKIKICTACQKSPYVKKAS